MVLEPDNHEVIEEVHSPPSLPPKSSTRVVCVPKKEYEQLKDEIELLRLWLIKIRKSTEIMEARRFAEQALKESGSKPGKKN